MPLLHCLKCHHEWEAINDLSKCDWCGNNGFIIAEKTPLEIMIDNSDELLEKLLELINKK